MPLPVAPREGVVRREPPVEVDRPRLPGVPTEPLPRPGEFVREGGVAWVRPEPAFLLPPEDGLGLALFDLLPPEEPRGGELCRPEEPPLARGLLELRRLGVARWGGLPLWAPLPDRLRAEPRLCATVLDGREEDDREEDDREVDGRPLLLEDALREEEPLLFLEEKALDRLEPADLLARLDLPDRLLDRLARELLPDLPDFPDLAEKLEVLSCLLFLPAWASGTATSSPTARPAIRRGAVMDRRTMGREFIGFSRSLESDRILGIRHPGTGRSPRSRPNPTRGVRIPLLEQPVDELSRPAGPFGSRTDCSVPAVAIDSWRSGDYSGK